jgi:hypothetical protein
MLRNFQEKKRRLDKSYRYNATWVPCNPAPNIEAGFQVINRNWHTPPHNLLLNYKERGVKNV